MARKDDPMSMDATVRRALTQEEVADRGRALAEKLQVIEGLREERKSHAAKLQGQIDDLLDECKILSEQILQGQEESRQGDLFAGGGTEPVEGDPDAPAPAEARGALAEIAARAGDGAEPAAEEPASSSSTPGGAYDFTGDEPTPAPVVAEAELQAAGRAAAPSSAEPEAAAEEEEPGDDKGNRSSSSRRRGAK